MPLQLGWPVAQHTWFNQVTQPGDSTSDSISGTCLQVQAGQLSPSTTADADSHPFHPSSEKKKKGLHGAHTQLRCNGPQPRKGTKDPLQGLKRREQTAQKGENPTPQESAEGTV